MRGGFFLSVAWKMRTGHTWAHAPSALHRSASRVMLHMRLPFWLVSKQHVNVGANETPTKRPVDQPPVGYREAYYTPTAVDRHTPPYSASASASETVV